MTAKSASTIPVLTMSSMESELRFYQLLGIPTIASIVNTAQRMSFVAM